MTDGGGDDGDGDAEDGGAETGTENADDVDETVEGWTRDGDDELVLGTRGSALAMAQTRAVQERLNVASRAETVETTGDRFDDVDYQEIGGQGVFVRTIDERVVAGDCDAAIHSMKDMPTDRHEDLAVAAVLPRVAAADALVTPDGGTLDELPGGAVVGTSSLRRRAQLRRQRSDLELADCRGNVDTRIAKMEDGDYDALVLSSAGLERLDVDAPRATLPPERFVPSANQGIVAVVARDGSDAFEALRAADDVPTRVVATAERIVLDRVGGGCVAPMGVHARIEGAEMRLVAEVLSRDGSEQVRVEEACSLEVYLEAAEQVARTMVERGAREIVNAAAVDDGDGGD